MPIIMQEEENPIVFSEPNRSWKEDHPWLEMPLDDSLDETVRFSLDEIRYA